MGFLKSIFGKNDRKDLFDLIEHKTAMMVKNEGKSKNRAEYLAICDVLDGLESRSDRLKKHMVILDLVNKEYSHHYVDVMTYLAIKSGKINLQPEVQKAFLEHHR
jgi:hypothetical protein